MQSTLTPGKHWRPVSMRVNEEKIRELSHPTPQHLKHGSQYESRKETVKVRVQTSCYMISMVALHTGTDWIEAHNYAPHILFATMPLRSFNIWTWLLLNVLRRVFSPRCRHAGPDRRQGCCSLDTF